MEKIGWTEDPVVEEIRAIRQAIHEETKSMTSEERIDWYNAQAQRTLADYQKSKSQS